MAKKKPTKKEMLTKKFNRAMALQGLVFLISQLSLIGSQPKEASSGVVGQRYDPTDGGINEQTINEKREVIRTIRREPYSDITFITERGINRSMRRYEKMSINREDEVYEFIQNAEGEWIKK